MRTDEATVDFTRELLGVARRPAAGGRTDPTLELVRQPSDAREATIELRDGDLEELVPPAPPPLGRAAGDDLDPLLYFPLGPPLRDLGDLDERDGGLRAFVRRLLFRMGWLRIDDGSPAPL